MSTRPDDDFRPPHGTPPKLDKRGECITCSTPTLNATLSQYGARCWTCYLAYCREPQGRQKLPMVAPRRNSLFPDLGPQNPAGDAP